MLRLPAVAGRFYPSPPAELTALIRKCTSRDQDHPPISLKACLVPHAGYVYSGQVAGATLARIALPRKIIILGVRHYPHGEPAAILSSGAWRKPLGDAQIDEELAEALKKACPLLHEDSVAHSTEQAFFSASASSSSICASPSGVRQAPLESIAAGSPCG